MQVSRQTIQKYFSEQIDAVDKLLGLSTRGQTSQKVIDNYEMEMRLLMAHSDRIDMYLSGIEEKTCTAVDIREEETMLFLKGFYKGATNGKEETR